VAIVSTGKELVSVIERLQAVHAAAMSGVGNDGNV
jgi:phosphoglycolate phosphatase